jgi:transcriptional regulator with XRE-family HTH domain
MSQERLGKETGIHPSLVAQLELGTAAPSREQLERMAAAAGLTFAAAEEMLGFADTLRRGRQRRGADAETLLDGFAEEIRSELDAAYRRLLALRPPVAVDPEDDRRRAAGLFDLLQELSPEARLAVVDVAESFQSWALCERACEASLREANLEKAAAWAHLALRIAERVQGPEEWRHRLRGYAAAHVAHTLKAAGDLESAETTLEEARRLWSEGADPAGVLPQAELSRRSSPDFPPETRI